MPRPGPAVRGEGGAGHRRRGRFASSGDLRDNLVVKNVVTGAAPPARASRPDAVSAADRRTRGRVARLLLELGPSTAAALCERLQLTPAAVRRHLDAMLADGTIIAAEQRPRGGRRSRGRPARVFALSDAGHAAGPASYDDLAADALHFLAGQLGEPAVEAFARRRAETLAARYAERVVAVPVEQRPAALARALSEDGYAASTEHAGVGVQLCQHHCPVQHVAEEFPQLCDAETEVIGRVLGTHVQRLATIAHGDGVCTTHIPRSTRPTDPAPSERTSR